MVQELPSNCSKAMTFVSSRVASARSTCDVGVKTRAAFSNAEGQFHFWLSQTVEVILFGLMSGTPIFPSPKGHSKADNAIQAKLRDMPH